MARSRDASRVVEALVNNEAPPPGGEPSNPSVATPDVDGDGASISSDAALENLIGIILQDE